MVKEELIHNYFQDKLTPEERKQFDKLLLEDTSFRAQFEFEKDAQQMIRQKEQAKLKEKLQQFETENKDPISRKFLSWKPLSIAASIVVILSLGWYLFTNSFSMDPEKLYAANYEKYPNTIYAITRGSDEDTSLEHSAFEAYESNEDLKSIQLFTELKEIKNPEYVDFYLAQSYLNNNQLEKAITLFTDITSHNKEFSSESLWYLALTYLKADKKERAVKVLEDLIEDGTYKKKEAIALLKKLK